MELAFLGLGHLGRAIAERLLERGHRLQVWNRTPERAAGLPATFAASPRQAATGVRFVFLCLFDSAAVAEVLTGPDGVLSGDIAGTVVIDCSTHHFSAVAGFHERCREAGAAYLEAPVLGSVAPARQGALTVLVSGAASAFAAAQPLLADIGSRVFYLERPTLATQMKLINNLALGSFMATLAEALALGEDVGIEKSKVLEILGAGAGQSLVLNAKKQKLLDEDFSPHFSNALIYKDLHCLQDLAYSRKMPLVTGAAVKELYARAMAEGLGAEDFASVYKVCKRP